MICPHCHAAFQPARKHQVYCCDKCRLAAYRIRVSAQSTIEAQAARIAELEAELRAARENGGKDRENAF